MFLCKLHYYISNIYETIQVIWKYNKYVYLFTFNFKISDYVKSWLWVHEFSGMLIAET